MQLSNLIPNTVPVVFFSSSCMHAGCSSYVLQLGRGLPFLNGLSLRLFNGTRTYVYPTLSWFFVCGLWPFSIFHSMLMSMSNALPARGAFGDNRVPSLLKKVRTPLLVNYSWFQIQSRYQLDTTSSGAIIGICSSVIILYYIL